MSKLIDLTGKSGPTLVHGDACRGKKTKEYKTWNKIVARCTCPTNAKYSIYGKRGIKVCSRWSVYENFLEDMGRAPGPEYSIDRINVDGDYEPSNCRWATSKQQSINKRNTVRVEYKGELLSLMIICEELNVPYKNTYQRIKRYGWSFEDAISY